jgi:hypothetical protein
LKTNPAVKTPAAATMTDTWKLRHHVSRIGISGPGEA